MKILKRTASYIVTIDLPPSIKLGSVPPAIKEAVEKSHNRITGQDLDLVVENVKVSQHKITTYYQ